MLFFFLFLDVLHTVVLLGTLGVVEAVQGAHQVAGDAADALEGHAVVLLPAAAGALVADDAGEAADGVTVHGVVHGAVADALFLHAADDLLEGIQVLGGVAVHLHIADVTGVGQGVVGSLVGDLVVGGNGVVHRHVEGVGVVLTVGNTFDGAVLFLVDLHEAAGQTLCGGGQQGEVHAPLLALGVHAGTHMAHDLQTQDTGLLALAVVLANEDLQGLGQADEAHGQGAVLQDLTDLVVPLQLLGVDPHALAHQEGCVLHTLAALELEALQQLLDAQVDGVVQALEEEVQVTLGLDAQAGQVQGGEGQVAAAVADLTGGIVHVADDTGAAAHVGDLGLRTTFLVVLQVEGGILEGEVGEQPLGAAAHSQLEQVIVGFAGVVVDAILHTEDLDGEDGGLAVAQASLGGEHDVLHDHAALGAGVHAVVDGGEGGLGTCTGVHGVQVVDQSLHGLVGGPVGLLHSPVVGELLALAGGGFVHAVGLHQVGQLCGVEVLAVLQLGIQAGLGLQLLDVLLDLGVQVLLAGQEHQGTGQVLAVDALEGLAHAHSHAVVEVHDGLAAVLVVLVGLDGDAGQSGIGGDVVGLTEGAVAGGETAVKELDQVDLGAGGGAHGGEVHVVDVDVAVLVGHCVLGLHDEHLVELLGTFTAVLEHGAHGSVAVDVGVFPLDVAVLGGREGDVLIDLHEAGVHLSGPAALGAVQDVGLGSLDVAVVHEDPFHDVLDVLHVGAGAALYF